MKKILNIFMISLLISGLIVAAFLTQKMQEKTNIKKIEIDIHYYGKDYYVLQADVEEMLSQIEANLLGSRMNDVNAEKIEAHLEKSAFISRVEVYKKINGVLEVQIHQRHPIARIETPKSRFYLASDGALMPISEKNVSHVMLVNGHLINYDYDELKNLDIEDLRDDPVLIEILLIANYIHNDDFLKAMIDQIYVNREQEFELVPKLGKHYVLLGDLINMEEKLDKLQKFYKFGISQTGWNKYKKINLKYKNQVVCTKI